MMLFHAAVLLAFLGSTSAFWVQIPTGFVGVRVVFGKVTPPLLGAGLNIYNSLTTTIEIVETRAQSDSVTNVECITNEGIALLFEQIEVGNQLVESAVIETVSLYGANYDKYLVKDLVRHQMNVICASKTFHQLAITEFDTLDDHMKNFIQEENDRQKTGLGVTFVRLTKPKMPPSISQNYLALAEEKTRKQVIEEQKDRIKSEKESEMLVARADGEILAQKAAAENDMMIKAMEAKKAEQALANDIAVAAAEANSKKTKLEAEGLASLYAIPGYSQVKVAEALSANQKIYYGEKIPQFVVGPAPV